MRKVLVFIINGFLEAGKTSFILSTIRRDEFYTHGSTLIIACEDGEIEYEKDELDLYNCVVEYISSQDDLNDKYLDSLYKKHKPGRIVMEMNLMWNQSKISFPGYFQIAQNITIIDGKTFPIYYQNMRQKFVDAISFSDVVAFTKLLDRSTLEPYQAGLKLINNQCLYSLINEECIPFMEAFEIPLPYDINSPSLNIDDNDFGIFYIDTFDNRKSYEEKEVTFNAYVRKSPKLPNNSFIAGREVMNCCSDDIKLYGFYTIDDLGLNLQDKSWVRIRAKCHIEFSEEYQEEELVLYPMDIKIIDKIKEPILDLR